MKTPDIQDVEIRLLLEGIFQVYGYDFREYSEASLRRRLNHWLHLSGFENFSEAQARVLRDREWFSNLVEGITVNVSEMFRDPQFFKAIRELVVPHLKTYPSLKIWVAGCSGGEEAYSMAILLCEEGLDGCYRIYATDINERIIQQAETGIYPIERMQSFTLNYQKAGGRKTFADYYTARYEHAILSEKLRRSIYFAPHNLTVDSEIGEMHMILCRNLLIYFKSSLKERILGLFDASLCRGGFLCLGLKETLANRGFAARYEEVSRGLRIFRKQYD